MPIRETDACLPSLLRELILFLGRQNARAKPRQTPLRRRMTVAAALLGISLGPGGQAQTTGATNGAPSASTVEVPNSLRDIVDESTYRGMSSAARERFEDMAVWNEPYVLIDKPNATGYVIGANHRIQAMFPVLLGRVRGDDPNTVNVKVDPLSAQGATTPAGMFRLSRAGLTEKDFEEYNDNIFRLEGPGAGGNSIHETWSGELQSREQALASPTPEDNRVSWGCVNVSKEIFEAYVKQLPVGTLVWITPET